jgi:hypothetical protein
MGAQGLDACSPHTDERLVWSHEWIRKITNMCVLHWSGENQIGSAIHRRRILEEIQHLATLQRWSALPAGTTSAADSGRLHNGNAQAGRQTDTGREG